MSDVRERIGGLPPEKRALLELRLRREQRGSGGRPGVGADIARPSGNPPEAGTLPAQLTVHGPVAIRAHQIPEACAVASGSERTSFAVLDRLATRLARRLGRHGVGVETAVGLCLEPSHDCVIALLAILKAGGAVVLLDPADPPAVLSRVISAACPRLVVTRTRYRPRLDDVPILDLDVPLEETAQDGDEGQALPGPEMDDTNLLAIAYPHPPGHAPLGLMITHGNGLSVFEALDRWIEPRKAQRLIAPRMLSIVAILQWLWALTRGASVVFASPSRRRAQAGASRRRAGSVGFSLFYFAADTEERGEDRYRLVIEGARFADRNAFEAIWIPERHFHRFGGLYPNPSVLAAALAMITERVHLRAGSVVLPLHNPIRVAEEWALVDNLSRGRIGIAFASGWHVQDFVLAPEAYARRREALVHGLEVVRTLWRGGSVRLPDGTGSEHEVRLFPRPLQRDLPIWLTTPGNPTTYVRAGEMGLNVLTGLLGQSLPQLAEKVDLYRETRRQHGHAPAAGRVTLMVHAFVGETTSAVRETVREPFMRYLRTFTDLLDTLGPSLGWKVTTASLSSDDLDALLSFAFERYFTSSGLFGTVAECAEMVEHLREIGVDEVACLIDFGVPYDGVLASLAYLNEVRRRLAERTASGWEPADQADQVTVVECTDEAAPDDPHPRVHRLLLAVQDEPPWGPGPVRPTAAEVAGVVTPLGVCGGRVMLGRNDSPKEEGRADGIILADNLARIPTGTPGRLYLRGPAVPRGYAVEPSRTAEDFLPDFLSSVSGARLYRTRDVARYLPDGSIEVLHRLRWHEEETGVSPR